MHIVIITSAMICTIATICSRRSHSHHPPAAMEWSVICCCMTLFAANALQSIVNGEENPLNCPFPLGFRHLAGEGLNHGRRQHASKNLVKIRKYPVGETDTQIHRQTDRQTLYWSHYFATAPAGEVIISLITVYYCKARTAFRPASNVTFITGHP